jgi:K+-transporting ATPase c subunit
VQRLPSDQVKRPLVRLTSSSFVRMCHHTDLVTASAASTDTHIPPQRVFVATLNLAHNWNSHHPGFQHTGDEQILLSNTGVNSEEILIEIG